MACMVSKDNKKFGFTQYGTLVIPLIYDSAGKFNDGLGMVVLNGKCGYVNQKGKINFLPF